IFQGVDASRLVIVYTRSVRDGSFSCWMRARTALEQRRNGEIRMSLAPTLDQRMRPLRDLRISVTDRCNFRCTYCMPADIFDSNYSFLKPSTYLSFAEIERLVRLFA